MYFVYIYIYIYCFFGVAEVWAGNGVGIMSGASSNRSHQAEFDCHQQPNAAYQKTEQTIEHISDRTLPTLDPPRRHGAPKATGAFEALWRSH